MMSVNPDTIPSLVEVGLFDAVQFLLEHGGFASHQLLVLIIYKLAHLNNIDYSRLILEMNIFSQVLSLMDQTDSANIICNGLSLIEDLLAQQETLGVNLIDYLNELGIEDIIQNLCNSENEIVASRSVFFLETYLS